MTESVEMGFRYFPGETFREAEIAYRAVQREGAELDALAQDEEVKKLLGSENSLTVLKYQYVAGVKEIVLTEEGYRERFLLPAEAKPSIYGFVPDPVGRLINGELVASMVGVHHGPRMLHVGLAHYLRSQAMAGRHDLPELYEPVRRFASWMDMDSLSRVKEREV